MAEMLTVRATSSTSELFTPYVEIGQNVLLEVDEGHRIVLIWQRFNATDVFNMLQSFESSSPAHTKTIRTNRCKTYLNGMLATFSNDLFFGVREASRLCHHHGCGLLFTDRSSTIGRTALRRPLFWGPLRGDPDDARDRRSALSVLKEEHVVSWRRSVAVLGSRHLDRRALGGAQNSKYDRLARVQAMRAGREAYPADPANGLVTVDSDDERLSVFDLSQYANYLWWFAIEQVRRFKNLSVHMVVSHRVGRVQTGWEGRPILHPRHYPVRELSHSVATKHCRGSSDRCFRPPSWSTSGWQDSISQRCAPVARSAGR